MVSLCESLLAEAPEEGCALLLGNQELSSLYPIKNDWRIKKVWPCCNVWSKEIFNFADISSEIKEDHEMSPSRKTRFLINPKEHLKAHLWARKHNLQILGSAHSHPHGVAVPSAVDKAWTFSPGLMVIVSASGNVRGWWMQSNQSLTPKEVACLTVK